MPCISCGNNSPFSGNTISDSGGNISIAEDSPETYSGGDYDALEVYIQGRKLSNPIIWILISLLAIIAISRR